MPHHPDGTHLAVPDHGPLALLGDVLHSVGSAMGGHDHDALAHGLAADPGLATSLHERLALSDPLLGLHDFSFPAFTFGRHDAVLVDTNGDGVMDHTAWGTPVHAVDPYVRADGTVVSGHFRTDPDGLRWNNLG